MNCTTVIKDAFAVIGKEGSTNDGEGFIQKLWDDANSHYFEIEHLAKRDSDGRLVGIWGAMSDFSRVFSPWEQGFSQGLYLAGIECPLDSEAPDGWTAWTIPAYEYLVVENHTGAFQAAIEYIETKGIPLAGAVQEFTEPSTGKSYLYLPIQRL